MIVFFNDTATTEIYTLSLHDALPIFWFLRCLSCIERMVRGGGGMKRYKYFMSYQFSGNSESGMGRDRKRTRLNSSHANTSYAVFCFNNIPESHRLQADAADPAVGGRL